MTPRVYFYRDFDEWENNNYMLEMLNQKCKQPYIFFERRHADVKLRHQFQELCTRTGFPWHFYFFPERSSRCVTSTPLFSRQSALKESQRLLPTLFDLSIQRAVRAGDYRRSSRSLLETECNLTYGKTTGVVSGVIDSEEKTGRIYNLEFALPRKKLMTTRPQMRNYHFDYKSIFSGSISSHTSYGKMKISLYVMEIIHEQLDTDEMQLISETVAGVFSPVKIPPEELRIIVTILVELGELYCYGHWDSDFYKICPLTSRINFCHNENKPLDFPDLIKVKTFTSGLFYCRNPDCPFAYYDYNPSLKNSMCSYYEELFQSGFYSESERPTPSCRSRRPE